MLIGGLNYPRRLKRIKVVPFTSQGLWDRWNLFKFESAEPEETTEAPASTWAPREAQLSKHEDCSKNCICH